MANLNYYAHEIDSMLKQTAINRDDIGMERVNVLPVTTGELELSNESSSPGDFPYDVVSVIGDKISGTVVLSADGEFTGLCSASAQVARLSLYGRGENDTGKLLPGKYSASLGSAIDPTFPISGRPHIEIWVKTENSLEDYNAYYDVAAPVEFVVPEDYEYVEILFAFALDCSSGYSGQSSCEFYPMIRLTSIGTVNFEPYKPDLQTQINELRALIEAGGGYNETQVETIRDNVTEVE